MYYIFLSLYPHLPDILSTPETSRLFAYTHGYHTFVLPPLPTDLSQINSSTISSSPYNQKYQYFCPHQLLLNHLSTPAAPWSSPNTHTYHLFLSLHPKYYIIFPDLLHDLLPTLQHLDFLSLMSRTID